MNGAEEDRPLQHLTAHEQALELVRLRGDMRREVTRLEGILEARRVALELQAEEYERRLTDLNHEADRIKTAQSESISVDKFDGYKEANDGRLNKIENFNSKLVAYGSILVLLWGLVLKFAKFP